MKPYFENGWVKIYNTDSQNLNFIPDNSIHLIFSEFSKLKNFYTFSEFVTIKNFCVRNELKVIKTLTSPTT